MVQSFFIGGTLITAILVVHKFQKLQPKRTKVAAELHGYAAGSHGSRVTVPSSWHDLSSHHGLTMDREGRREPRASELADDVEDARVISGLPNETTQV